MPAPDAPRDKEEKAKVTLYVTPETEWRLRMHSLIEKRGPSEIVEEMLDALIPRYKVIVDNSGKKAGAA
jgi:hypothetical protein